MSLPDHGKIGDFTWDCSKLQMDTCLHAASNLTQCDPSRDDWGSMIALCHRHTELQRNGFCAHWQTRNCNQMMVHCTCLQSMTMSIKMQHNNQGSDSREQGAVTVQMHTMASHFSLEVFSFVITAGNKCKALPTNTYNIPMNIQSYGHYHCTVRTACGHVVQAMQQLLSCIIRYSL